MHITLVRGDVCTQDVDTVVTAANEPLRGGGGVDRAVHLAAGPELLRALRPLAPCPAGGAVVTPSFDLQPARWIIHAVGPRYRDPGSGATLQRAYRSALAKADEVAARSVAFPSISTGSYGYPAAEAAVLSVAALRTSNTDVERVVLVAFRREAELAWRSALDEVAA
jgi:O-acetyl-ADP-ribose deacetylase (regulator of RNase III)